MSVRDRLIPNFLMPLFMDRSNLGKFAGAKSGDIILARKFASVPKDGIDIDCLDDAVGAEVLNVVDVFKNFEGETINLNVEIMWHESFAAERPDVGTFRLDGDTVGKVRPGSRNRKKSFLGLYSSPGCSRFVSCAVNPGGDMIRRHVLGNQCSARCESGWLRGLDRLDAHMPTGSKAADFPPVPRFRPLCPVCMGSELVVRQIKLRVAKDGARHDEAYVREAWEPFQRAVKQRYQALGYEDMCTCPLCLFPSTSHPHPSNHAEAERMHQGLIEYNITTAVQDIPASEDAIAALPQMKYADAATDATRCTICQTDFVQHTAVAQLPCKHVICAENCIDWLRHQNSCPECRHKIPAARVKIWTPSTQLPNRNPRAHGPTFDSDSSEDGLADNADGLTEVRRMGNEDPERARARGGSIDASELPIGNLSFAEQQPGIYGIGLSDSDGWPEGSENWSEVDWTGSTDMIRSSERQTAMHLGDDLEYELVSGMPVDLHENGGTIPWPPHGMLSD